MSQRITWIKRSSRNITTNKGLTIGWMKWAVIVVVLFCCSFRWLCFVFFLSLLLSIYLENLLVDLVVYNARMLIGRILQLQTAGHYQNPLSSDSRITRHFWKFKIANKLWLTLPFHCSFSIRVWLNSNYSIGKWLTIKCKYRMLKRRSVRELVFQFSPHLRNGWERDTPSTNPISDFRANNS